MRELLESFASLEMPSAEEGFDGFEIIFADASPEKILHPVIAQFSSSLPITHLHKPYLPISPSRNLGAETARGDYVIFLDSDVILPPSYLKAIHRFVKLESPDAFGGPDEAHPSFTTLQKAISFAMTSYLTTGGIRGKKKQIHQYNPRGFNMGVRKEVFSKVNGYSNFVCGEDIELSIRIIREGFKVCLIPEAFVYHKRRTNFKSFFRQVFRFGAARVNLYYRHRDQLKLTHMFPAAFFLFVISGLCMAFIHFGLFKLFVFFMAVYYFMIFLESTIMNKSISVGALSVVASTLQLCGYGLGFLANWFVVFVQRKPEGMRLGASK